MIGLDFLVQGAEQLGFLAQQYCEHKIWNDIKYILKKLLLLRVQTEFGHESKITHAPTGRVAGIACDINKNCVARSLGRVEKSVMMNGVTVYRKKMKHCS